MNLFIGVGNLTRDVELAYTTTADPKAVAKFSIAINEGYGDSKKVNYIPCVVFGKRAENCEKYLNKGSKVSVKGKLVIDTYEKDGIKKYYPSIICEEVEFLSKVE